MHINVLSCDDGSVYKIKSVLQENENVYKVIPMDSKSFNIYFNEGKTLDSAQIQKIIKDLGFTPTSVK